MQIRLIENGKTGLFDVWAFPDGRSYSRAKHLAGHPPMKIQDALTYWRDCGVYFFQSSAWEYCALTSH